MIQNYINIEVHRGASIQTLEFPEERTRMNRFRWWLVKIISPVNVRWFE